VKVVVVGPIVSVWPPVPPVEVPEIDPLTPPCVAVTVTFEAAPAPTTNPVEFTVTQALELSQVAEWVTSFVPLSKVAVAFNCTLGGTEKVLAPDCVVTETEFGWLTKKPLQPTAKAIIRRAANASRTLTFRVVLIIMRKPRRPLKCA